MVATPSRVSHLNEHIYKFILANSLTTSVFSPIHDDFATCLDVIHIWFSEHFVLNFCSNCLFNHKGGINVLIEFIQLCAEVSRRDSRITQLLGFAQRAFNYSAKETFRCFFHHQGCYACSRHIFNGLYMFNVDTIKGNGVKGIKQQRQEKPV